jgi:hypothetical protein
MPISMTVREPTSDERAVVARRMDLKRRAAAGTWKSRRSELNGLAVMFGTASVGLGIAIVKWPSVPLGFGLVMCLMMASMAVLGRRKDRARVQDESNALDQTAADRARAVTEYRLTAGRIVVASGDDGDGEVWWFFRADDGKWLVFEIGQWEDLDPSAQTWRRDITIGVDGHHTVVSIATTGAPLAVERHDLQPPDYTPTADSLFWASPDDLGPLPAVIDGDPVLTPVPQA